MAIMHYVMPITHHVMAILLHGMAITHPVMAITHHLIASTHHSKVLPMQCRIKQTNNQFKACNGCNKLAYQVINGYNKAFNDDDKAFKGHTIAMM